MSCGCILIVRTGIYHCYVYFFNFALNCTNCSTLRKTSPILRQFETNLTSQVFAANACFVHFEITSKLLLRTMRLH